jgi:hypothetical protein
VARDPEREQQIRKRVQKADAGESLVFDAGDVDGLLEEIDYLRSEVQNETAHASQLRRQLESR